VGPCTGDVRRAVFLNVITWNIVFSSVYWTSTVNCLSTFRCTRLSGCIRLRNDLCCVVWGVKLYLCTHRLNLSLLHRTLHTAVCVVKSLWRLHGKPLVSGLALICTTLGRVYIFDTEFVDQCWYRSIYKVARRFSERFVTAEWLVENKSKMSNNSQLQAHMRRISSQCSVEQWWIKKFWKGRGRKTICQLPPHLSQMHTTKYVPFARKKSGFLTKNEPIRGGGRRHRPLESASGVKGWLLGVLQHPGL